MADALTRLRDYGQSLVASLQERIRTLPVTRFGPVSASGALAASLRYEVAVTPTGYRLSLYAAGYALALEYGRRPGRFPPLASIQLWIEQKGIVPHPDAKGRVPSTRSLAYLIGRKIAQQGTTLYQAGSPSGLFGQVLAPEVAAEQLAKLLLPVFREEISSTLHQALAA